MMTDLTDLTIADARKGLDARDFTATELTGAYLEAIEARNGELNAYIAVTGDIAREQAELLARDTKGVKSVINKLEVEPVAGQ